MANCFTRQSRYPRYLSKKDHTWFDKEFYLEGGASQRYGPDHLKEKIVSFNTTSCGTCVHTYGTHYSDYVFVQQYALYYPYKRGQIETIEVPLPKRTHLPSIRKSESEYPQYHSSLAWSKLVSRCRACDRANFGLNIQD